jgi:hypothetical protein
MNVDNLVERGACRRVNSAKFNTMIRIAQFWCNECESDRVRGKQFPSGVTEDTELLVEKHNFFDWREFETGKLLQMNGCEEKFLETFA